MIFRYLLKKALDAVVARADSARDVLRENIAEMMNRLFSVLKSVVLLATFDHEPENKVSTNKKDFVFCSERAELGRYLFSNQ
jgi:hypothetical protein